MPFCVSRLLAGSKRREEDLQESQAQQQQVLQVVGVQRHARVSELVCGILLRQQAAYRVVHDREGFAERAGTAASGTRA
jgi:hypothetical protein